MATTTKGVNSLEDPGSQAVGINPAMGGSCVTLSVSAGCVLPACSLLYRFVPVKLLCHVVSQLQL